MSRPRTWLPAPLAIFMIAAIAAALYYEVKVPPPPLTQPRWVSIRKGETLRTIAPELQAAGVVRSAAMLKLYAQVTRQAERIMPGDYAFRGGEDLAQVLRHLVSGDFTVVTVTVPEGLTVHQIAERLEQAGLVCEQDFERQARHDGLVHTLGLGPLGAEGYLFPATYRFSPRAGAKRILTRMLERFFDNWTPQVEQRRFALGLTTGEVVTLASIVEKEAKVAGERPLIAGVFYNRMKLHMPLQSDPTAQYSFEGIVGPAHEAVHRSSAFNTYDFAGLPPGPIANPGWSSIEAVLYPAHSDYLYFVARSDGTHVFSRTLREHQHATSSRHAAEAPLVGHATIARAAARPAQHGLGH